MESMSQAPHVLKGLRAGHKYGDTALIDSTAHDALYDHFTQQNMGLLAEERNRLSDGLTRHEQDVFAAASHQRATAAASQGFFADEIAPVTTTDRAGQRIISADEGVRPDTTVDSLTALRPAFSPSGTITAGTSSQISDGAAAVVVMSKSKAQALGLPWLAEIGASGQVAGPDSTLQSQPANAIKLAAKKQGIEISDIDLFEINEAFAAVAIQSARDLGVEADRVNVNGGAIALGHPVGMSGTRVALTLAYELRRRGGGIGAAALCGGGGQGDALILTAPPTS
jgi:acetyl-CoA C-acetyltransferase